MPEFGDYDPSRWGWPSPGAGELVPFEFEGASFAGGVAALAAPVFTQALSWMTKQGGLQLDTRPSIVAGNWGAEVRKIAGSNNWSFHAYGLALDLAAPSNPSGSRWPPAGPYRVPDGTGALLAPLAIEWGGDWAGASVDRMHIELHAGPVECVAIAAGRPAPAGWPLPAGYYYGPYSGPTESISGSGRNDAQYRAGLAAAQGVLGVSADGYYGPITRDAILRWQAAHGLEQDGLLGPATWSSLFP